MVGHEGEREREGGMKKIYLFCLWSWDGLHFPASAERGVFGMGF